MGGWTDKFENTVHVGNCFGHEDGHSTALCPCELRNGPRLGVTRFNWRDYFDSYGILDDPDDYAIGLGGGGGGGGSNGGPGIGGGRTGSSGGGGNGGDKEKNKQADNKEPSLQDAIEAMNRVALEKKFGLPEWDIEAIEDEEVPTIRPEVPKVVYGYPPDVGLKGRSLISGFKFIRNIAGKLFPAINNSKWVYGSFKSATKWANQLAKRGWTEKQITEAITNGKSFEAINNINPSNGALRYVHPTSGKSVVIDKITKELLHVGGDGFLY